METKHNFKLPLFVSADDYHEFGHFCDMLSSLTGEEIEHREIETDPDMDYTADLTLGGGYCSVYFAIVFPRRPRRKGQIDKLIQEFLGE